MRVLSRKSLVKSFSISCFSFVVALTFYNAEAQQKYIFKEAIEESKIDKSSLRYIIVGRETELEKYVNRFPEDLLLLEVLLADKDFNETNLIKLSKLLSKRYASTKNLSIYIYTSLEAIKNPEENDQSNLKGHVDNIDKFKHAIFSRNSYGNEWFTYSIPKRIKKKIVVVKGCYIECKQSPKGTK